MTKPTRTDMLDWIDRFLDTSGNVTTILDGETLETIRTTLTEQDQLIRELVGALTKTNEICRLWEPDYSSGKDRKSLCEADAAITKAKQAMGDV